MESMQSPPTVPLSAEEFLSILEITTADLLVAETAAQFDEILAATVLLLQERMPDPAGAARVIAAFSRGVMKGAGCPFPWQRRAAVDTGPF
jgi:hypothetical protein